MSSSTMQLDILTKAGTILPLIESKDSEGLEAGAQARELKMWVRGLRSFFSLQNRPQAEINRSDLVKHDWTSELRIVKAALLRASRLVFHLIHLEKSDSTIFDADGVGLSLSDGGSSNMDAEVEAEQKDDSLYNVAALLDDACELCESLLEAERVSLHAWTNLGESLMRLFDRIEGLRAYKQIVSRQATLNIPASLLAITRDVKPAAFRADLLRIFSGIFELLHYLSHVEKLLRRDQSLKQTLPVFTLVHDDARALNNFIRTRTLKIEGLEQQVFEILDGTNYAIRMELRKVFAHELLELSSLRQAPAIYIKVETAQGLLSNCFRQSAISLAQLFNPSIEGSQLFNEFQTRLEQSIVLRRDLWVLLQLVRRAEKEPEHQAIERLMKKLVSFYEGSLRYLMFKDWESCERFMEEIGAARGAAELSPVLHRFTAYLEALSSQVNMRAVLLDHPFDYPEIDED
ncbi:MAG TPA: hypothetical protein VKB86_21450 [Pyrinomonadaceae bacterium]|nr:hypothetical protein [Pyrinomonadaceae bacterium]